MLGASNFIVRHLLNILFSFTAAIFTWVNLSFIFVPLVGVLTYIISNYVIKVIQKYKRSKQLGLTHSEYRHIEEQLKQAKNYINVLTQQYIRVRSIKSFKLINDISKISRRIVNIVQSNPQKFYTVEDFFYSHLPSAVEVSKNYTTIVQQQIKDTDFHLALEDARNAMKSLHLTMEDDLKAALEPDLENLKLELDFVKLETEKKQQKIEFRRDD